jgi:hypothetical protein
LFKINLKEKFIFLHNLGLNIILFGKNLKKCYKGPRKSNFFIIVIRSDSNKFYYRNTIPEKDLDRFKN